MISYQQFANKYLSPSNQKIDYDHAFAYQCVDLIRQYWYECYGLGDAAGGPDYAINYWITRGVSTTPAGILAFFDRTDDRTTAPGDVVIIADAASGNDATSHIGIATGAQNNNQFEMIEQNGGTGNGDGEGTNAIRTRWLYKSRIAGILRPKAPAAVPTAPPQAKYQVVATYSNGKQIRLNKQPTNLWGMNFDFEYMKDHPIEVHGQGEIWTVTNRVHHQDGYDYYRRDGQQDGFNVLDCDDYTPPAPLPAAPEPYQVAERYTTKVPLRAFQTADDAKSGSNQVIPVYTVGEYYVWAKDGIAYNLTTDNMKAGLWINILEDKVPDPVPVVVKPKPVEPEPRPTVPTKPVETAATIRSSYLPIMPDGSPIECEVKKTVLVTDLLHAGGPITARRDTDVKVYGTFLAGGNTYALVKINSLDEERKNYYMYGIPVASRDNFDPYLDDIYRWSDRVKYGWENFFDKSVQSIDGIFRKLKRKK